MPNMDKAAKPLSETIREFRESKGWSQQYLAGMLGVTLQTVWRWEHGVSAPSQLAMRVLRGLGVSA